MTEENKEGFAEECWFIYGIRAGKFFAGFSRYHSKGTSGSVEFDWKKAMTPFLIGWIHSHGAFGPEPSGLDDSTMRSWVKGKARPFICGIYSDGGRTWNDYFRPGCINIYRSPMSVLSFGSFLVGRKNGLRIYV